MEEKPDEQFAFLLLMPSRALLSLEYGDHRSGLWLLLITAGYFFALCKDKNSCMKPSGLASRVTAAPVLSLSNRLAPQFALPWLFFPAWDWPGRLQESFITQIINGEGFQCSLH